MTYSDKFNSLSCRKVFLRASRKKDPAEKKNETFLLGIGSTEEIVGLVIGTRNTHVVVL